MVGTSRLLLFTVCIGLVALLISNNARGLQSATGASSKRAVQHDLFSRGVLGAVEFDPTEPNDFAMPRRDKHKD